MPRDDDNKGGFPIPGAAGEAVRLALQRMALNCGECTITISKERVPGGGYVYTIANHEPPAVPARKG